MIFFFSSLQFTIYFCFTKLFILVDAKKIMPLFINTFSSIKMLHRIYICVQLSQQQNLIDQLWMSFATKSQDSHYSQMTFDKFLWCFFPPSYIAWLFLVPRICEVSNFGVYDEMWFALMEIKEFRVELKWNVCPNQDPVCACLWS